MKTYVGTISDRELKKRVRKVMPPVGNAHKSKKPILAAKNTRNLMTNHYSQVAAADYLNMIGKPQSGPLNLLGCITLQKLLTHHRARRIQDLGKANKKK